MRIYKDIHDMKTGRVEVRPMTGAEEAEHVDYCAREKKQTTDEVREHFASLEDKAVEKNEQMQRDGQLRFEK